MLVDSAEITADIFFHFLKILSLSYNRGNSYTPLTQSFTTMEKRFPQSEIEFPTHGFH